MKKTLIERVELASAASSITFSSIPQTYDGLYVVASCRSDRAEYFDNVRIKPNGSATNGTGRYLFGTGSSAVSGTEAYAFGYTAGNNVTSNTFGNISIYIPNYTSSNYKSISTDGVGENNATSSVQAITASLWSDTSAITSLEIDQGDGSNWQTYSSFALYGITAGSDGTTTVS